MVAAVVFDYRGLDTLGEEFILFAAVSGVVMLLRGDEESRAARATPAPSAATRCASSASRCIGAGVLVGLWLAAFGLRRRRAAASRAAVAVAVGAARPLPGRRLPLRGGRLTNERVVGPAEGIGAGALRGRRAGGADLRHAFLHNLLGPRQVRHAPLRRQHRRCSNSGDRARGRRRAKRDARAQFLVALHRATCRSGDERELLASTRSPPGVLVGLSGDRRSRNLIHLALCLTVTQSSTYVLLLLDRLLEERRRTDLQGRTSAARTRSTPSCRRSP